MNKTLITILAATAIAAPAANSLPATIRQNGFTAEKTENTLYINADLDLTKLKKGSNREVWITPLLVNGSDTLALPAVLVAGRNRYYQALRHDTPAKEGVTLYRASDKLKSVPYSASVPYEKWMNGSELMLRYENKGCCSDDLNTPEENQPLGIARLNFESPAFMPAFNWVTPTAEAVKQREINGQAFIDFPVNKTVIYPDYRRNTVELAKIRATIDSVRNDKDITITALSIKGFASPEGPWANNVRLAKGRTAALKTYVEQLYHFSPDFIATSYDPEDWGGLRAYVASSNLADRQAILDLIDSNMEPDAKNSKLERAFPEQYRFLLAEVYPALRHSDYKIEYTIRGYSDVNEILRLVKTRPQNLSLQEFFLAAQAVEPGSTDYNDIFETAVRMYPQSEVANLNAANAAMSRGDFESARRYLDKAGEDGSAVYARGVLAAMTGNLPEAKVLFQQAARMKVADAPAALTQVEQLLSSN